MFSNKFLESSGRFHSIKLDFGRTVCSDVHVHLILVSLGVDKAGVVGEDKRAQPQGVEL